MQVDPTVVRDVVVVLPGIMGSELSVGNKRAWSLQKRTLMSGILTLGRQIEPLIIVGDDGYSDPDDQASTAPAKGRPPRVVATYFW